VIITRVGYRKPVPMWCRFQYNRYYPDQNATHISVPEPIEIEKNLL